MIIGFDYWQVISHYPTELGAVADALHEAGHTLHVISAIGPRRIGTIVDDVRSAWPNFPADRVHEVVFEHPRQSPELKLARCQELGITMFFDDRDDVCRVLSANGILAMRVPRKDGSRYDLAAERSDSPSRTG